MNTNGQRTSRLRFTFAVSTLLFLLLAASLYSHPAVPPDSYTDDQLFGMGLQEYQNRSWVTAAVYLFAYVQRSPQAMSDSTHAQQVTTAYNYCVEQINRIAEERNEYKAQLDAQAAASSGGVGRSVRGISGPPPQLDAPPRRERSSLANSRRCVVYSQLAVTQNELNTKHSCEFQGNRWSSDFDLHYNWCLTAPDTQRAFENAERERLLNQCADFPSRVNQRRGRVNP